MHDVVMGGARNMDFAAFPRNGKLAERRGRKAMGPVVVRGRTPDRQAAKRRSEMAQLRQFAVNFIKAEDGPTAVEYAVMLALIIVVCITAVTTLGSNANKTFTSVGAAVGGASS
jgi:pilus assembly protein Flp/PilA